MLICFPDVMSKKPREEQIEDLVRSSYALTHFKGGEEYNMLGRCLSEEKGSFVSFVVRVY